ncbi:LexA family protein [Sphingomonas dokdonensis]|nr:LexA family transcriptional regulator [Sphingomonas dokdonensis]
MVTHDALLAELQLWVTGGRVTQKEVADELGIPPPRVNEILKHKRRIQQAEMPVLAQFLGLSANPESNVRKIKRIGRVPAGELRQALVDTADTLDVSADLPRDVFALEIDGESMNRLAPYGADVIVDPNDKSLFSGDLYVVGDDEGQFTFKQFLQDPARLVPLSDDPSHKDIPVGTAPINIIGRVVSLSIGANHLRKMVRSRS